MWPLIQLQRLAGSRGDELVRMRAVDLNASGEVWTFTPSRHKTAHFDHKRTIDFGPRATDVLEPFIAGRPVHAYLFSPREGNAERQAKHAAKGKPRRPKQKPNRRTTARRVQDHYATAACRRANARACKLADAPRWHPHQLPRSAATEWRKAYGRDVMLTLLADSRRR